MMVKWMASTGTPRITRVEAEKETASSVWIKGRRHGKLTDYESYFDSWDEAKSHLLTYFERRCSSARRQLEYENGHLGNIKGLKKPADI